MQLNNISKSYSTKTIYENFNLQIKDNDITVILGESGSGKTTLLNIIAGLTDYNGSVQGIDGNVSYMFSQPRLLPNLTVKQNLEYILADSYADKKQLSKIISKYLTIVELQDEMGKYPHQLSSGMEQRVALARTFAYPAKVILMDEPFKGLDMRIKHKLERFVVQLWNESKRTIVAVTHDIAEAISLGSKIYMVGGTPCEVLYEQDISQEQSTRSVMDEKFAKIKKEMYELFI